MGAVPAGAGAAGGAVAGWAATVGGVALGFVSAPLSACGGPDGMVTAAACLGGAGDATGRGSTVTSGQGWRRG